jgi:DNA-binding NtrC family response regulator
MTVREAFARISEGGIDCVVVDSFDPRVGVVELAKNLDALPDAPPVVLVSPSPQAPEISARIGAAMFLPKPLEPGDLVAALARIVGEVRPTRPMTEDFSDEETTSGIRRLG